MPPSTRPMRQFDLIVFDWDGTLFDSTALIGRCIQAAVADVGGVMPSDKDATYVIGMGLGQALAHAAPDVPPEKYPLLAERYKHHYAAHRFDLSLFSGVLAMLERLKQRQHLLAVATGKSRQGLNVVLQDTQLQGVFDSTRTADETAGKPHPLMLHELMAELGVPPERTLMIGDTTHDLQMALHAGCASVGVSYGAHPSDGFAVFSPLYTADSVAALDAWLHAHA